MVKKTGATSAGNKITRNAIPLGSLELNEENARHGNLANEAEVIKYLMENEYVRELAADIAERGLSPLHLPAVVDEGGGKYRVEEGNRRICALKTLTDPTKAPTTRDRKLFQRLASKFQNPIPKEVDCVIFDDLDTCREWVRQQHTSSGVGRIRHWDPMQQARFDPTNPNQPALALIDYAKRENLISSAAKVEGTISTIMRYLRTPEVRKTLGLGALSDLDTNAIDKKSKTVIQTFLKDVIKNLIDSRTGRTSKQRKEYAAGLKTRAQGGKGSGKQNLKSAASASARKGRVAANTEGNKYLIPDNWEGAQLAKASARISAIVTELQNLKYKEFRFATGALLRLLTESVVKHFVNHHQISHKAGYSNMCASAATKLEQLILQDHATPRDAKDFVSPLRVAIDNENHVLSYKTQSAWVHGTMTPSFDDLQTAWKNMHPILAKMLELSQKP